MSEKAEAPKTLRAYFHEVFQHSVSKPQAVVHKRLVHELIAFLGYDPLLEDVTANLLNDYCAWCKDRGLAECTIADRRRRLARIVRHAIPVALPSREQDRHTLRWYFVEMFQHSLSSRQSVHQHRRVVVAFIKFLGYDPKLVDITPNMLRRFGQQLRETWTERTVVEYERRLRRQVRSIDSSKFRRVGGGRPSKKKPQPKRRRNSLLTYMEKRYCPSRKMADKTAVFYGSAINKLNTFTGRDVTVNEVTPLLIGSFLEWCLTNDSISTQTVFGYAKAVADVYRDAEPEEYDKHATEWQDVFGKQAGRHNGKPKGPVNELAERYILEKEPCQRYAENVIRAVRSIEAFAGSAVVPCGLTTELVSEWLASLQDGTRSNTTVRQYRAIIVAIWNWASDIGMCEPPIARRVKRIKVVTPIPVAWSLPDVQQLLYVVDKLDGTVGDTPASLWWGSLCRVAYDTGIRVGDLLEMMPDALQGDLVVIRQSKTQKPLCRRLRPGTVAKVEAMKPGSQCLLWPWPFCETTRLDHFRRIVKAAGLTGTFKYLRRTSGTLVEAAHPGAGSIHLSHSSRKVFEDHYLDFRQTADSQPMPPSLDELPANGDVSEGGAA